MNEKMGTTIKQWILYLMGKQAFFDIDDNFDREDGMNYSEYQAYEHHQFMNLSAIYDLNEEFHIQILHHFPLGKKHIIFFYLLNNLQKIVCKMSLTLIEKEEQYFLSSNNYDTQVVPKYRIDAKTQRVTHVALAIKSPLKLINIVSPQLSLINFAQGDNFLQDGFHHALFDVQEVEFNQTLDFYISMLKNSTQVVEKRRIFFDIFDSNLQPYKLAEEQLFSYDEHYPVHLSYWKQGENYNIEYPRHIRLDIHEIDKLMMTDCLDNDWIIK